MKANFVTVLLIVTLVSAHDETNVSYHDLWSLTGRTGPGPREWASTYPLCNGSNQTPIDIPAYTEFDPKLRPFEFVGYETLGPGDMEIINVGWSASVVIKDSSIGKAYFTGGGFPGKYIASQFHFHWGPNNNSGSDHSFQGKFFPAEVHIGHFKEDYGSVINSTKYPDGHQGLAVWFEDKYIWENNVAIIISLQLSEHDNPNLEPYLTSLEDVTYEGDRQPVGMSFDKVFPNDTSDYYQYNGSIPLPPCLEVVVWTLFKDTSTISHAQLSRLRKLYDGASNATHPDPHLIDGNQRGVQPLGNRIVRRNFIIGLSTKREYSKV